MLLYELQDDAIACRAMRWLETGFRDPKNTFLNIKELDE